MPISAEKQKLYPGGSINSKEWKAIRARIQERAGDACEWCKVENGSLIHRSCDGEAYIYHEDLLDAEPQYSAENGDEVYGEDFQDKTVKIVCTTAHLNHDPADNRDDNLAFLCQRCHLRYDHEHHKANAEATRRAKLADGDLFE